MELNIITAKTGARARESVKIAEIDFWEHYLYFLNLRSSFWINQKEVEVFSWVLSQDPDISWFSKPHSDVMKKAISRLSDSEITRVRRRLKDLGLVQEMPDPDDLRKNLTFPSDAIRKFQRFVKNNNSITIIFPYEITE